MRDVLLLFDRGKGNFPNSKDDIMVKRYPVIIPKQCSSLFTNPVPEDLQPKSNTPRLADQEFLKVMIRWSVGYDYGWSLKCLGR